MTVAEMAGVSRRSARVLFKGRVCGRIVENADGSTVFAYADRWREPIACALPTDSSIHPWRHGLHPVFQHMTAEGWLREKQARVGVLGDDDDLGLLLRYGRDCIGAVSVEPEEAPSGPAYTPGLDAETAAAVVGMRTVSGVQKKLLVVADGNCWRPAAAEDPAPFIAKFPGADLTDIVRNENLTLRLARHLLGPDRVTGAETGHVDGFGPALIVRRFDRTPDGARLRLEDMAQVLGRPRGRENDGKYDADYEEISAAIRTHSARPLIDLQQFLAQIVTAALLGNCDAHLKNFSLLETAEGLRLAPAYDLVNTVLYRDQGYNTHFALRIDGEHRQHDRVDGAILLALGHALGLKPQAVRQTLRDLKRRAGPVLADLRDREAAEPEPGFHAAYADIVRSAFHRIFPDD